MRVLEELRRRNVHRMAALYVVGAWLVSQVADVLFGLAAIPPSVGRLLLAALVVGFPIVLVLSWFYELTPEGVVLDKDLERDQSASNVSGRKLDFVVIAMLLAAVFLFAWHTWVRPIPGVADAPLENSVAVLAFDNLSGDADQVYFSDGVAEQLLDTLAQQAWLVVKSRSSSFSFKGKNADIPTIAKALHVSHIIEGSVRKDGNRLRITAQLIDATNDAHIWSETFDRGSDDIFAIQDEVANAVVEVLREQLDVDDVAPVRVSGSHVPEAQDAYLRGRHLVAQRYVPQLERAVHEFEKALEHDPGFAAAHAELAMALIHLANRGGLPGEDARARAEPHALLAMELDALSPEAHAASGFLHWRTADLDVTMKHFERATQLNPSYAIVYAWMAILYRRAGRYTDGFVALEKAVQLDPLSTVPVNNYAFELMRRERLDEARYQIDGLAAISPTHHAQIQGALAGIGGNWAADTLGTLDAMLIDQRNNSLVWDFAAGLTALGLDDEVIGLTRILGDDALGFLQMNVGRYDEMLAASDWNADPPKGARNRGAFGVILASVGDFERAQPYLEELWREPCNRTVTVLWCYTPQITSLIFVRRAAGQDASEIIEGIRDDVRRQKEAGITMNYFDESPDFAAGLAEYLDGNREAGFALMRKAVEDGYYVQVAEHYLQPLFDDPGFAPILAIQKARQERESARFLDVVCNDNPYAEVWEPLPSTCEQFVTAVRGIVDQD